MLVLIIKEKKGKFMGISIKWDITYRCNLFCDHCLNGNMLTNEKNEISKEEIITAVNNICNYIDVDSIHLLGGEPTVREDFLEICRFFNDRNIKFGFNSNGLLLNQETIETLMQFSNLRGIVLSLEGPTAEINDHMRGKRVFDTIIKRINQIDEIRTQTGHNAFELQLNCVVTRANYTYITDMLHLCNELPIDSLSLLQLSEQGNASGKKLGLSFSQLESVVKDIAIFYTNSNPNFKIKPRFVFPMVKKYVEYCLGVDFPDISHGCGAGSNFAFINNKGEIFPCDRLREIGASLDLSLLNNDFLKLWSMDFFNEPFSLSESGDTYKNVIPCNKCEYLHKNCYPCYYSFTSSNNTASMCQYFNQKIEEKEGI